MRQADGQAARPTLRPQPLSRVANHGVGDAEGFCWLGIRVPPLRHTLHRPSPIARRRPTPLDTTHGRAFYPAGLHEVNPRRTLLFCDIYVRLCQQHTAKRLLNHEYERRTGCCASCCRSCIDTSTATRHAATVRSHASRWWLGRLSHMPMAELR